MSGKVLVFTLGFDIKFHIKSILRHGRNLSKIIIVLSKPLDDRAQKAFDELKKFINEYVGISFEAVTIDPLDFYSSIKILREKFRENIGSEYVFNLSGGMRAVVLATLLAALYSNVKSIVEVELENFRGIVSFPISVLSLSEPSSEEKRLLKYLAVKGSGSLDDISSSLGIPRTTAYKMIKNLESKGYITGTRIGKKIIYTLTELSKIWV